VGKRGPASFKRLDALRAVRAARDSGIEPAMIEIVATDGVVYRVYGEHAVRTETTAEDTKTWDKAISKLKAKRT
jgi:hypothetical protein